MPRYAHDITDLLKEADVRRLYEAAKDERIKTLVCLFWITGARPAEILELDRENISVEEEAIIFTLPTKKLQADGTKFVMKFRQLRVVRPHGMEMNIYLETVVRYIERLRPGDGKFPADRLFDYSRRWVEKSINQLGIKVLGKQIAPYHFRHSAMTREASQGRSVPNLMHYKGAKSMRSVMAYVHAMPYELKVSSEPVKKKEGEVAP